MLVKDVGVGTLLVTILMEVVDLITFVTNFHQLIKNVTNKSVTVTASRRECGFEIVTIKHSTAVKFGN